MITRPTVFILGAGASAPYGYPTAKELRNQILNDLTHHRSEENMRLLEAAGHSTGMIKDFVDAFRGSSQGSIDAFLSRRPEFSAVGRCAIGLILLGREHEGPLFEDFGGENWYQHVWSAMDAPFDRLAQNTVKFITFNYDRSLEHFLFTSMRNTYGKTEEECALMMGKFPIVHVHGSLGPLPWQGSGRAYQATRDPLAIQTAGESIRVLSEATEDTPEFTVARDMLKCAGRAIFLGFGYHQENLRRLHFANIVSHRSAHIEIFGTLYDLTSKEAIEVYRRVGRQFDALQHPGPFAWKNLELLRQRVNLTE